MAEAVFDPRFVYRPDLCYEAGCWCLRGGVRELPRVVLDADDLLWREYLETFQIPAWRKYADAYPDRFGGSSLRMFLLMSECELGLWMMTGLVTGQGRTDPDRVRHFERWKKERSEQ